jgi:hypothetical protein
MQKRGIKQGEGMPALWSKGTGAKCRKRTAQGCLGLVILVAVLYFFFGGSDDDKGDAKAKATTQQKECSANDSQCIFNRYIAEAAGPCKQLIEKSAKYDFEWTDGFFRITVFTYAE